MQSDLTVFGGIPNSATYLPISGIILPNSIESIGNYAFQPVAIDFDLQNHNDVVGWSNPNASYREEWLYSLQDYRFGIKVNGSLQPSFKLGDGAFQLCKMLPEFKFSFDGTWDQEEFNATFFGCDQIETIVLWGGNGKLKKFDSTEEPGIRKDRGTFQNCWNLKYLSYDGESLETIGNHTFENCYNLETVYDTHDGDGSHDFFKIPEAMDKIPSFCFTNCKLLKGVKIHENIKKFEESCLEGCESLEKYNDLSELSPSSNRNKIEFRENCFKKASLGSITYLPEKFDIYDYAFSEIKNTRKILYDHPINFSQSAQTSVKAYAFSNAIDLEEIDFSYANGFYTIGECAFSDCKNLKIVKLPKDITLRLGKTLFLGCDATKLKVFVPFDYGMVSCDTSNDTGKPQLDNEGNVFVFKDQSTANKYLNEDDPNNSWLIFKEWMGWEYAEQAGSITLTNPYNTWNLDWTYLNVGSIPITAILSNHNAKPYVSFHLKDNDDDLFSLSTISGSETTLTWDRNLPVGSYKFYIEAQWNNGIDLDTIVKTSELVSINIHPRNNLEKIIITGAKEIWVPSEYRNDDIGLVKWNVITSPYGANNSVVWDFKPFVSFEYPSAINFKNCGDGAFRFESTGVTNLYKGTLTAVSTVNSQIQDSKDIIIHTENDPGTLKINGNTQIKGLVGEKQSSQFTVSTSNYMGSTRVNWSIEPTIAPISIDQNGLLSWNVEYPNHFNFNIIAISSLFPEVRASLNVTLDIEFAVTSPLIEINFLEADEYIKNDEIFADSVDWTDLTPTFTILNPLDVNHDLWDFENPIWELSDGSPDFATLIKRDGHAVLRLRPKVSDANQRFFIGLTCTINPKGENPNQPVKQIFTAIVNVIPDPPTSISIAGPSNLQGLTRTAGHTNAGDYYIDVNPDYADKTVLWSITKDSSNGKIHISDDAVVSWEPLSPGSYNFEIQAMNINNDQIKTTKQVTLTISGDEPIQPILGDITLTGDNVTNNTINTTYHSGATAQAYCQVLNEADLDPSLQKVWQLSNAPSGVSIDPISGLITVSRLTKQVQNQVFQVHCYLGNVIKSLNVTLNINYQAPVLGQIYLSGQNVSNNTIYAYYNETTTINAYCLLHNPLYVDPSLQKVWGLQNAPRGVNINPSNGTITISKQAPIISNQILTIICKIGSTSVSLNATLNVVYAPVTNITIAGQTEIVIEANQSGLTSYQAFINPLNANPNVTWSILEGNDEHIKIDPETGILSWDDQLLINHTYNLKIVANSNSINNLQSNILEVTLKVKSKPYVFPIWAYPTIVGSILLLCLIVILFTKRMKNINNDKKLY